MRYLRALGALLALACLVALALSEAAPAATNIRGYEFQREIALGFRPQGLVLTPAGGIIVGDPGGGRIVQLAEDGTVALQFVPGTQYKIAGAGDKAAWTSDSGGYFYVWNDPTNTDADGTVDRFSAAGTLIGPIASIISYRDGLGPLHADANGNLYFVTRVFHTALGHYDYHLCKMSQTGPVGTPVEILKVHASSGVDIPGDYDVDAAGNIYVVGRYGTITRLESLGGDSYLSGTPVSVAADARPTDIAFAASPGMLVTDSAYHKVRILSDSLTEIGSFGEYGPGSGQLDTPREVVVGPNGNAYVLDAASRIQVFRPLASLRGKVFGPGGSTLAGVSVKVGSLPAVTTDRSGQYEVTDIPEGQYSVVYSMNGFEARTSIIRFSAGDAQALDESLNLLTLSPSLTSVSGLSVSPSRPRKGRTATFSARVLPAAGAVGGAQVKLYQQVTVTKRVKGKKRKVRVWKSRGVYGLKTDAVLGTLRTVAKVKYKGLWKMEVTVNSGDGYIGSAASKTFSVR